MWPGQQPPGGEQNPQDPNQNPYQQAGYQQPNPYQQPGYQQPGPPTVPPGGQQQPGQQPGYAQPPYQQPGYAQPNPYQQPTVPQYAVPGQPPGPPTPPPGGRKNTTLIAIVAATAVVVAAGVTGFLVLNKDDESTRAGGDGKPSQSASKPADSPSAIDNPRDGSSNAKPTIPGWKVVYNPKYGTQFDVPADWEVGNSGGLTFIEDKKKNDGQPILTMSAPAYFKGEWCTFDTNKDGREEQWSLATVATKGGQGAKDTAEASYNEAFNWVYGAYAQLEAKGTVKATKAVPYTSKSGLTGHVSTATALNTKKDNKCDTDGKSIAFSFKNAKGDFASWVLYANAGIKDELANELIQQILSTVRLAPPTS
ncbi:hypothetical protein [Streptomyces sp. SP18CS02]|uniref:hypothetical protein n=1 Tax=Streptomyces sp. SP18CS02 TaxID=3002531 RepID=UPI002E79C8BF|nr:hypothetical protein [Streptomyces sp. SP18CS02]MEE1755477.1 hypothetical protein [Streptomyces sp. SP18CS02]